LFGIFKLAGTAPERIPGKQVADATLHLADIRLARQTKH
jgi:hypothetical protein